MRTKKQRVISFLMAFLLIFTFAFINPLTVQKSQAFAPAVLLTPEVIKIVSGVVVSCGLGIAAGQALQEVDYEGAVEAISTSVWNLLKISEKMLLTTLSIVDNIVQIPVDLYNSIKNKAELLYNASNYAPTLLEQGITIQYLPIYSKDITQYPNLSFPIYNVDYTINTSEPNLDLTYAEPFLVYNDNSLVETDVINKEGFIKNSFKVTDEYSSDVDSISSDFSFTNSLVIKKSNEYYNFKYLKLVEGTNYYYIQGIYTNGEEERNLSSFGNFYKSPFANSVSLSNQIYKLYFLHDASNHFYVFEQCYNKITGDLLFQEFKNIDGFFHYNPYGLTTMPLSADVIISPEIEVAPTVSTNDGADIVLTLPNELSETIGLTSSDVNVQTGTGEGEGGTNTETMENINTNVGELVTGGTLGEEVNTNIGTVEGLHGELTEQVDFGAVFDTIAQYISALDISSVTWFPVAVASFLVPFLPVISLGLILFFIDRVLNGGA